MSLFGSLLGDFEDDPIFGHHMRSMRQMNSIMNSLMPDPFGMMSPFDGFAGAGARHSALTGAAHHRAPMGNSLMPFGFQSMPNINSLLNGDFGEGNSASFCSSSFVSMSHGPDGRPQVYQATSSTKTGPGGVRETRKTVQDSRSGLKKMAIGHHIGERAHIIERERNVREGTEEERQDFINLEEEEAEDFDREFTNKVRQGTSGVSIQAVPSVPSRPALPAPPSSDDTSSRRTLRNIPKVTSRRPLRTPTSSPLALPPSTRTSVASSPKRDWRLYNPRYYKP
ncbi:myeloid leukemia factor isoform X2 [Hermetia illucens]|uniref:myeloid leukemia factor isoform X2 n=1 Tax=Hermetia illucens TaxID=343691 RepID=UPI0018CC6446|nr:myeloid leukemia factor isoform X2 [Hermetia illucens]